ncbi:tRNA/tmRNA/rRNA uracil-C5-methylase (TrmA/RlmC/RlmD family) [Oceanithermus desulfurans]|uniref:tRNA/tmRNA/rRNA uracil-C5-methylase (TrmA/RlmC/RlmD family) n=1 Tax=Oceanithermus desulfurans TaxID=227924 RepID=A0ABR6NZ16_9DEIN|nr:tRNA/tmRNA/rRNA uracil-C5-methylase (TrmA/RlmC/RlmD family) [Oceanithermus desulfurans]
MVEILEPSPDREDPGLPPGADLPMRYEAQLPVKEGFVRESLTRVAQLEAEVHPIRPSPAPLGYRTAAQFALHPLGGLAYRRPGSDELVRVHDDPLLAGPLREALKLLNTWPLVGLEEVALRGSLLTGEVQLGLVGGKARHFRKAAEGLVEAGIAGVWWGAADPRGRFRGPTRFLAGKETLLERYGELEVQIDVVSFAQVNPRAAAGLYAEAAKLAGTGGKALELYGGSGVLGFFLARNFAQVTVTDLNRRSIEKGRADAARLGLENVRFARADAREAARFGPAELVAVDPPRSGLAKETLAALLELKPQEIVYIACDPATWARDVARLTEHGYRLDFARPYDFFPYTHHVEVLSYLTMSS